jgi:rhodanese-related sulfurtransferase
MSNGKIQDIDCNTLADWLKKGEAFLVDVREAGEHAGARIAGSTLNPLSAFDPSACTPGEGQKLVLYCGSGMRSMKAGKMLLAAGGGDAFNLVGGIQAWHKAGHPIDR